MRKYNQQIIATLFFMISLLIMAVVLFHLLFKGQLFFTDAKNIFVLLLGIYSVHIAVIVGGFLGQEYVPRATDSTPRRWVALGFVALWNALLVIAFVAMIYSPTTELEEFTGFLNSYPKDSAFLVIIPLAFLFTGRKQEPALDRGRRLDEFGTQRP